MSRDCLTCRWRVEPRTPECSSKPEYAATCDYPLPVATLMKSSVTDVERHINLATTLEDSPFFNEHHASRKCPAYGSIEGISA